MERKSRQQEISEALMAADMASMSLQGGGTAAEGKQLGNLGYAGRRIFQHHV